MQGYIFIEDSLQKKRADIWKLKPNQELSYTYELMQLKMAKIKIKLKKQCNHVDYKTLL